MPKMKVAVFVEPGRIVLDEKPIPDVGPLDALVRITTTTICGTDVHILKGEYPVARGLTIGHEPVGVIEKLGSAVQGYREGQRVIAGAITPSGHSEACLCGCHSQDGAGTKHGWKPLGGWRFGNTIDGCQAEYVLVPDAMANLAPVPDGLTDEQVLMCPDIMSTGFSRRGERRHPHWRHRGGVRARADRAMRHGGRTADGRDHDHRGRERAGAHGDGAPDGRGLSSSTSRRPIRSRRSGASRTDAASTSPSRRSGGRQTFEAALRVLRPGGTLSSLGVYSGDLTIPLDGFLAGLGDHTIRTTLCPGGKERMRRLMACHRVGPGRHASLVTHRFKLDQIEEAYDLFAHQRDGVLKVAITP